MKMLSNAHTHTNLCDGADTPEVMAEAALALGFSDLGFSAHSPAPFDIECPGLRDEAAYRSVISALAASYAGRLGILCGVEQDYLAPVNRGNYDYIIGSVHYLPSPAGPIAVDADPAAFAAALRGRYGGDSLAMVRDFFSLTAENARKYRPDIVGHFDLIAKFNADSRFFSEDAPPYRAAALEALDAVIGAIAPYGGMIEINTGAMSRGLRALPYPSPFLLRHMAQKGARAIITTDSHSAATLTYGFERALELLRQAGFASMAILRGGAFVDVKL